MKSIFKLAIIIAVMSTATVSFADPPEGAAKPAEGAAQPAETAKPAEPAKPAEEPAKPIAKIEPEAKIVKAPDAVPAKKASQSGWKLSINGFMRGDATYNLGRVFMIDSPMFAHPESATEFREKSLSFSARFSRLKFTATAPEVSGFTPYGVIEGDFYGNLPDSGTSIRQSQFRMRLAYAALKNKNFDIRFGNDWMVAAPNFANALEPFNLWGQGNLWMRYPQISVRSAFELSTGLKLHIEGSVGQNMGNDSPRSTVIPQGGIGESTGLPVVQGRAGVSFKNADMHVVVGGSASWQKLKLSEHGDATTAAAFEGSDDDEQTAYFIAADLMASLKINKDITATVTAEFYKGQGAAMYWGAILMGPVNITDTTTAGAGVANIVRSTGFFADLKVTLPLNFTFFAGLGMDKVKEEDVPDTTTSRISNTMIYGGFNYSFKSDNKTWLILGAGASMLTTEFRGGAEDGKAKSFHLMAAIPF
ncbi:hypothetical protein KKF34_04510 [Myxococcota bacterium]|nr:hypothetical protein [Myxococcota bacterium]